MNLGFLTENVKIHSRKLVAVTILASSSLAWVFFIYYTLDTVFKSLPIDLFWGYAGKALFLSFGGFFMIIGSMISGKVSRRKLLWSSITLGVAATASLALFPGTVFTLLSTVLIGISLGLGYPCFTAFLADCTVVEERARVSGLVILETFIMVIIAVIAVALFSFGLTGVVLLGAFLRSTGYLALILDPCDRESGKEKSWRAILANKDFSFYLFPWLMFNIASGLISFVWTGLPKTPEYDWAQAIGGLLHFLGAGVFGFTAGFLADRLGRKQPIIIGMVMLGVSFAFLGLATSPLSVLTYLTISGIAWGFVMVVYLAVPGDLALPGSKEKFYALGISLPLIIIIGIPAISDFLNIGVPANSLSSVLSIIIFISVVPVLRASETLPETSIRERQLKEHVEKVGKLVEESKKTA
jgi:MFS family permease